MGLLGPGLIGVGGLAAPGLGITGSGGAPAAVTALAPGDWSARVAQIGDIGESSGASGVDLRTVTFDSDTRRVVAALDVPLAGILGIIESGIAYTPPAIGEPADRFVAAVRGPGNDWLAPSDINRTVSRVTPCRSEDDGATWVIAGAPKDVPLPPRADALTDTDWQTIGFAVAEGVAGLRVSTAVLGGDPRLAWSLDGTTWTEAPAPEVQDDTLLWTLAGLTGDPAEVVTGLRLRWAAVGAKTSADSDVRAVTLPDVPAAFTSGEAALADDPSPTGDRLTLSVSALPASDLSLTAIEYALSTDNVTYGAIVSRAAEAGTVPLTVLGATYVRVRAVSPLGAGPWFTLGPVTPTTDAGATASFWMLADRTTIPRGASVHLTPDAGSLDALAAAWGIADGGRELQRNGWFFTSWSTDPAENYAFDRRGLVAPFGKAWTAGESLGPYVAHQYRTAGDHTCTTTFYYGANVATWTRTITVQAPEVAYPPVADAATSPMRVFAADGDFTGLPTAYADAPQMTDWEAAMTWWQGGDGRCLLFKGGTAAVGWTEAIVGLRPKIGSYLGPWNDAALDVTRGTVEAFRYEEFRFTASAAQDSFTIPGGPLAAQPREVYVDGLRRTSGYTWFPDADAPTRIDFSPALTGGEDVRCFRRVFGTAEGDGIADHRALIALFDADDVTIERLNFLGDYDAVNPTTFDGDDLGTFNHCLLLSPFSAQRAAKRVSISRVYATGWHTLTNDSNSVLADGPIVFADCAVTNWRNYGFYTAVHDRYSLVGCTARQPWGVSFERFEDGKVGEGNKSFGAVGVRQDAAHGPIRMSVNRRSALHENIFASSNSWSGQVQPTFRLSQNSEEGLFQSSNFTRNEGWHGSSCMGFGGTGANGDLPAQVQEDSYAESNVLVPGRFTVEAISAPHFLRSRNNIILWPEVGDVTSATLVSHTREATGSKWFAGGEIPASHVYNDTVIIKEARPGTPFYGVGRYEYQKAGFARTIGPEVTAAGGETVLTFAGNGARQPDYGRGSSIRAYELLPGGEWLEIGQSNNDRLVEPWGNDPNFVGKQWVHPGDGVQAGWTVTQTVIAGADSVMTLTFAGGRTAVANAKYRLTWNPTLNNGAGVTFYEDLLEVGRARDIAPAENMVWIFDGALASVTLFESEGPIDASGLTTAGQGPFTGIYRPAAGSAAYQAATTGRVAKFSYTGALRGANPSRGALEPGDDQTGWLGLPAVPAVTFAWGRTFAAGDTVSAADLVATVVNPGVPAINPATDIGKEISVLRGADVLSLAAANPLQPGDTVRGEAWVASALVKRDYQSLPAQVLPAASFTRAWIANGGQAALELTGAEGPNGTDPIHVAFRAYLATPIPADTRRLIYSANSTGLRINIVANTGRLTLNMGSSLVNVAGSELGVGQANARSFLISVFPGGTGPGGITGRMIVDGVTVGTSTTAVTAADLRSLRLLMLGFTGTPSVGNQAPDIVLDTWFGIWTGGAPTFGDFFDTGDGNRVLDPTAISVSGMTSTLLLNGLIGFNLPNASGSSVVSGYPVRTVGASFAEV